MKKSQQYKKSGKAKSILTGIMFFLALVLVLGVILQVFGTGKTKPSEWFKPNPQKCTHEYAENRHECIHCGFVSDHVYAEGEHDCTICGMGVNHFYEVGSHECVVCGKLSAHEYAAGSHVCKICSEVSAHDWEKGVCKICAAQCEHENENDVCRLCGMSLLEFTVTFQTNGGSDVANVKVFNHFTVAQPEEPTKEECHFGGWYTDESCTAAYDFNAEVCSDLTLYAKWIPITYYTVTLTLNGGEIVLDGETSQDAKATVRVENNTALSLENEPTREGYDFKGWFTNSKCTTAYDFTDPVTKNFNLYALWAVKYLKVNFNPDEAPTTVVTKSVRYGQTVPEQSISYVGHTFCGWYTREVTDDSTEPNEDQYIKHVDGVTYLCTAFDFETPITKDLTLYARWHMYAEGSHVCQSCGEVSDHTFENGVCTVCGICETHDYEDGVCTRCEGHEIRYFGVENINEFIAAYPELLTKNTKAGETVTFDFGGGLSVTKADGVVLNLTVTALSIERYVSDQGYGLPIDAMQTDNVWSFTVPEESGTIDVTITGTVEQVLPDGYHTISYAIEDFTTSTGMGESSGYFFADGPKYAKKDEIVMVRIQWTSSSSGATVMPTINRAEYSYDSTGISDRYAIVEGQAIVLFFKVTGDANVKLTIS